LLPVKECLHGGSRSLMKVSRQAYLWVGLAALLFAALLIIPLIFDGLLYRDVSRGSIREGDFDELVRATAAEAAAALTIARTVNSAVLLPYNRHKGFVLATRNTDAAFAAVTRHHGLEQLMRGFTDATASARSVVEREGVLHIDEIEAKYAVVSRNIDALRAAWFATQGPETLSALARSTYLSEASASWAEAGSGVFVAYAGVEKRYATATRLQKTLSAFSRANRVALQAEASSAKASIRGRTHVLSTDTLQRHTAASVIVPANSTIAISTNVEAPARAARNAYVIAASAAAAVHPHTRLELAQLIITCCAIGFALLTIASAARVMSLHTAGTDDESRMAAVDHMTAAHQRVSDLMDRILRFDCTDAADVAAGPALSQVEAELRALLTPVANAVAHVPRAALVSHAMIHTPGASGLSPLESQPSLRIHVSMLFVSLSVINDVSYFGDSAKAMPQRVQRLRNAILSEVLRRGGLPVLTPLSTWAFAWNLNGADKTGIQSALQCATSILGSTTVDFPSLRIAVVTGTVATGAVGTATCRMHIVTGGCVLLVPTALRIAQDHGAALVADAETQANCSAQAHRARPIEVAAPSAGIPGVVLYDMLSSFDTHDARLMQWNRAFEKYHTGRAAEAVERFKQWAQDGSDRTVERLLKQLEQVPPKLVTVGEAPPSVFSAM
jgi:hypothetical protein